MCKTRSLVLISFFPPPFFTEECQCLERHEDLRSKLDATGSECIKILGWKAREVAGLGVENKPVIKTKNTASFGSQALHVA